MKLNKRRTRLLVLSGMMFMTLSTLYVYSEREDLNLLLITVDTLRPDRLGCYSTAHLKTPQMDALAERGVVFDRAFAHNPLTLPSHVNILLGKTPLYHGVHENSHAVVLDQFLTMAEFFKDKGYSTGAFVGAFPLDSRYGLDQGFDIYDESYPSKSTNTFAFPERKASAVVGSALSWLNDQKGKWFLWIHLWDPHAPYLPPEPFLTQFKDDLYSGEVAYVDSELAKVFGFLDEEGLVEKTLVVLTGDHGEALGEHGEDTHGYFAYNSTLWVPLIFAGPEITSRRVDLYVSHIDIFPTVCQVLGYEEPEGLQGKSLRPLMGGKRMKGRPIYFESLQAYYHSGWAPLRGYIEKDRKFIHSPIPELYDLSEDFGEGTNIVEESGLDKYEKRMKELQDLLTWTDRPETKQKVDREALEKLRSLGYVVSAVPQTKKDYGPEDDLKTLLPILQKQLEAMDHFNAGKAGESIKLMEEIIEERPDFEKAYYQLSQIYESQGRVPEALAVLEKGFTNNPQNYEIVSKYGIQLVIYGQLDRGMDVLKHAVSLIDFDPDVWMHLGIGAWQKGNFDEASDFYRRALALDADNAVLFNNLGMLHFSVFMQKKNPADYIQASEYFKKAIERDPTLASAYNGLGGTYNIIGQKENAISLWEKAVELDPYFDLPVYNLGMAYFEKGDKAEALKHFERYLEMRKNTLQAAEKKRIEALIARCKK
ncbi:MAG: sulfatase-like hydrolase/transferase [Candidatus Aminicenantes bacterium]